jgi:chorismate dehydratase
MPGLRLVKEVPSRLTPLLARGELDAALIPVMGYLQTPGLEIVPGVCISSRGIVQSVRLFHRKPLGRLRRICLDASSMTSAALTRVILADRHGLRPEFVSAPPVTDLRRAEVDAVLLIGDNAMRVRPAGWSFLDLGAEWKAATGLPFVYAVWAARPGIASPGLVRVLNEVKDRGLAHVAGIARSESRRLGLSVACCRTYLTEHIFYGLGPAEIAGLREFRKRVIAHGLAPKTCKIRIARG